MRQEIICECCGRIGHKSDACIIRGPNFLTPSLKRKMKKLNDLHGDKPTGPPIDWNRQTPEAHFKSRTSTPKTIPVVSAVTGRLNYHTIDNGDVEVQTSEFPF